MITEASFCLLESFFSRCHLCKYIFSVFSFRLCCLLGVFSKYPSLVCVCDSRPGGCLWRWTCCCRRRRKASRRPRTTAANSSSACMASTRPVNRYCSLICDLLWSSGLDALHSLSAFFVCFTAPAHSERLVQAQAV